MLRHIYFRSLVVFFVKPIFYNNEKYSLCRTAVRRLVGPDQRREDAVLAQPPVEQGRVQTGGKPDRERQSGVLEAENPREEDVHALRREQRDDRDDYQQFNERERTAHTTPGGKQVNPSCAHACRPPQHPL